MQKRDSGVRGECDLDFRKAAMDPTSEQIFPLEMKAVGSQWIYNIKYHADDRVGRLKARLVVFGNRQVEGMGYTKTFSSIAKLVTLRLLLAVAAAKNWELRLMDVHKALMHDDLSKEVYFPW